MKPSREQEHFHLPPPTGVANPVITTYLLTWIGREWPEESLGCERRFGFPAAKLYPFIGRKVLVLGGEATLLQVFSDRAMVVFPARPERAVFIHPSRIKPIKESYER